MKAMIHLAAAMLAGSLLCCGDALARISSNNIPVPFSVLYQFEGIQYGLDTVTYDGSFPQGALIQAADGNFYGTTQTGGTGECTDSIGILTACGTVFRVSVDSVTGAATTSIVYSFQNDGQDGTYPTSTLVQAADGNFYGTTNAGGAGSCSGGCGTVFRISIDRNTGIATETVLYSFQNDGQDGTYPYAGLIQGKDGNFYGTTVYGGFGTCSWPLNPNGCGTAFSLSIDQNTGVATEKVLHSFQNDGVDGNYPVASLTQGRDGSFYGTTFEGSGGCSFGTINFGCGSVYRISLDPSTSAAAETIVYSFGSSPDNAGFPLGSLVQDSKGDFYGTTSVGGAANYVLGSVGGTVFRISIDPSTGAVTPKTLYAFTDPPDGSYPAAGLLIGHDGNLYGTTQMGGTAISCIGGCGTVFQISIDPASDAVSETQLHSFDNWDGIWPMANLIQGSDGNLYGTTSGLSLNPTATGGVFRIAP